MQRNNFRIVALLRHVSPQLNCESRYTEEIKSRKEKVRAISPAKEKERQTAIGKKLRSQEEEVPESLRHRVKSPQQD